jgi:hypothetical protein
MRSCGGIVGAKRSSAASIAARFGMLARLLPKLIYFKSTVLVIHGRNRTRAYYIRSTYDPSTSCPPKLDGEADYKTAISLCLYLVEELA